MGYDIDYECTSVTVLKSMGTKRSPDCGDGEYDLYLCEFQFENEEGIAFAPFEAIVCLQEGDVWFADEDFVQADSSLYHTDYGIYNEEFVVEAIQNSSKGSRK